MDFFELEASILFEDDDLLVIAKPAGWVVNRSHTQPGPTVQDWMEARLESTFKQIRKKVVSQELKKDDEYGTPEQIFLERGGVAHRLDKDTSGVMVLAKNPETLVELMRQFKERETSKKYLALVHGKVVPNEGIINLPMERSDRDKLKFAVQPGGRVSETQYKVLEHFPGLPKGMHQRQEKRPKNSHSVFRSLTVKPGFDFH